MALNVDEFKKSLAEHRIARAEHIHEIATEDVSISAEAIVAIRKAATDILVRFVPGDRLGSMSLGDIMHLFAEKLFWNDQTGGLLMCSELGDGTFCLPIPREHWVVSPGITVQ
jgi:hypothetical protein